MIQQFNDLITQLLNAPSMLRCINPSTHQLRDFDASIESISIDYGSIERSNKALMVPTTFQWSDLGSWAALDEIFEKDRAGNILTGNTIDIGSQKLYRI